MNRVSDATPAPGARAAVDFEVAIVGSGFAGLCTAIRLQQEGRRSFVILEKADRLGGTWRENHYPGCACDVPSHLYSFSFAPNPGWSRMFAPQAEILAYLERCADRFRVREHIRFGTAVTRARFDEDQAVWRVETDRGRPLVVRHLVFAIGALSRPAYPQLPGIERFRGRAFHSAAWDHSFDFAGKRVAAIGTGASAIQFVPQIAGQVDRLHLFQRTPPWVLPKPDRPMTAREQRLFARLPLAQRLFRAAIYARLEARTLGFTVDPRIMKLAARLGRSHIEAQIADPALRAKVTPDYMPGCKRILMADDYYPALARPNVEVVTDGIREVTATGLVTADGRERTVDAIVYGTGFRVTDLLTPLEVIGRGGRDLNEVWQQGMEAYLGGYLAGFPNFYFLLGPNTGLGHNSIIFMIEAQVRHVLQSMRELDRRGARTLEVRPAVQRAFNDALQPRLQRSIWASGCQSWYLDQHGKNPTLWPGFTFEYWWRTRRLDPRAFAWDAPATRSVAPAATAPRSASSARR